MASAGMVLMVASFWLVSSISDSDSFELELTGMDSSSAGDEGVISLSADLNESCVSSVMFTGSYFYSSISDCEQSEESIDSNCGCSSIPMIMSVLLENPRWHRTGLLTLSSSFFGDEFIPE